MARLNWGMIGGGEGSQIGPAHRLGARLDGNFVLCGRRAGRTGLKRAANMADGWALAADRAYGDWREMLEGEKRAATIRRSGHSGNAERDPFRDHQGFPRERVSRPLRKADDHDGRGGRGNRPRFRATGRICAVNYGYTGYSMVRHMKAMVARGDRESSPGQGGISPRSPRRCSRCRQSARPVAVRSGPGRASRRSSPIAAFTRCTWPVWRSAGRAPHGGRRRALHGGGPRGCRFGEGRGGLDRRAAADVPLRPQAGTACSVPRSITRQGNSRVSG
jgi:hypothetical protein